jgi:ABC-type sugar transport system ATPase subunit
VAENIRLGRGTPRRLGLFVNWPRLNREAAAALARLGASGIDPRAKAGRLGTGAQMLTVLARLVAGGGPPPRVFVLDEPTAALTHAEAERLFSVLRDLRTQGAAILYVSHRLDEVMALSDRVTVLRDGRVALTAARADVTRDGIIRAMTGRDVREAEGRRGSAAGATIACEVEDLAAGPVTGVGFALRRGEVLGLAGLEGAGQSDLLRVLAGVDRPRAGRIRLSGKPGPRSPHAAWRAGIAHVPRERRREGLMPGRSVIANTVLPHLRALSLGGVLARPEAERRAAQREAERVRLRHGGLDRPVRTLSGGNQQKVLFARAMTGAPRILLLDEPTRGVDVGARADLHALIRGFTAGGGAVVVSSSDLPELLALSDRILVLRGGRGPQMLEARGLDAGALLAAIYGEAVAEGSAA